MKLKRVVKVSVLSLTLVGMAIVAPVVGARSARADTVSNNNSSVNSAPEQAKVKVNEKKIAACQKKQASLTRNMKKLADQGEKQLAVFDKISTKVQEFYDAKGYNVATYDTLVDEVAEAKVDASAKVQAVLTAETTVDCEKDPKAKVNSYKEAIKTRSQALKDYKTAVHKLLLAVKNSQRQNIATDQPAPEDTSTDVSETATGGND